MRVEKDFSAPLSRQAPMICISGARLRFRSSDVGYEQPSRVLGHLAGCYQLLAMLRELGRWAIEDFKSWFWKYVFRDAIGSIG